jgi:hypothetical protein
MKMWINFKEFNDALSMCDLPPTLYSIMESMVNYDNPDPVKIRDLSTQAKSKIFDFYYPVSELFPKDRFEDLFLKHYMFRRINYDTVTSFKLHLEVKLNDIMPKYYKMLEGFTGVNFDGDVETHTRTQTDSKTSTSNSTINNTSSDTTSTENKFSDMPQDLIDDIKDDKYVTEYTQNKGTSNGNSNSNSTNNTTDNGNLEETITIKRADSIDEYQKYLQVMNNIYSMIFKECDSLFYGLI